MSSHNEKTHLPPPLDLSLWSKLPAVLMTVGAVLCIVGLGINQQVFGLSWLLAFMFYLSVALGALFLVLVHHLTDAGWSVGIRRFCEHIASLLFPWLATHDDGDIVVTGVILKYRRQGLSYLNSDASTTQNYRVNMVVHVVARERSTDKILLNKDVTAFTLVNVGSDLASSERQATPLLAQDLAGKVAGLLTEGAW